MFDVCIKLLFKQAEEATDYLRILVKNFEGVFDNEECTHLRLFYLMLPALTLNYIEHIQKAKDKIQKKNNKDAFISDDGFPLGMAYLLKILN
jgi:WASH complex subunit 7